AVGVRRQAVSHASYRLDGLRADLLAEVADVDVDDVRSGIEVVAPDVAEQLLPAQHVSGVAQEGLEEHELPSAEVTFLPSDGDLPRVQVQTDVPGRQDRARRLLLTAAL